MTVGLSVMAHGYSAVPLVERYARWFERLSREGAPAIEAGPAHEHRLRGAERTAPAGSGV